MLSPGSSWKRLFGTLQNIFLFKKKKTICLKVFIQSVGVRKLFSTKKVLQPHLRKKTGEPLPQNRFQLMGQREIKNNKKLNQH